MSGVIEHYKRVTMKLLTKIDQIAGQSNLVRLTCFDVRDGVVKDGELP